jgi:hypothetical protein
VSFSRPVHALHQLEQSAQGADPLTVAGRALETDHGWFDGLDVGTAWVLCWFEQTGHGGPQFVALGNLTAKTTRSGYRLGRLLLGADQHPELGPVEQADLFAAHLFDLTSNALCADTLSHTPASVREATAALAQMLEPRWHRDLRGSDRRDLRRTCTLSCVTGVTLAIVEHQLAFDLAHQA